MHSSTRAIGWLSSDGVVLELEDVSSPVVECTKLASASQSTPGAEGRAMGKNKVE